MKLIALLLFSSVVWPAFAGENQAPADCPQRQISNGLVHAKLYLPDPEHGYYRGSRFDWSGVIASLEYQGHNYFGQWFPRYDPRLHDSIMGPVEEFRTDDAGLGYNQAPAGGTFIKIGVGVLRKPKAAPYTFAYPYPLVNTGKWSIRHGSNWVEFTQKLTDASGYGYIYKKTVRLVKGKPELLLEHSLKNTGKLPIETSVYDHDFYVIDKQPTGPDFTIKFPFTPHANPGFKNGLAEVKGNDLVYLRELQGHETAQSFIEGFGNSPSDYDIRVENRKVGAGVRQTSDHPIAKINFWSIRTTVCPEAYIDMKIEPGQESKWQIRYQFYTISSASLLHGLHVGTPNGRNPSVGDTQTVNTFR